MGKIGEKLEEMEGDETLEMKKIKKYQGRKREGGVSGRKDQGMG